MRKRRKIEVARYVLLSVGISVLIIHTALPYYCLTSIALPGWNIYWFYEDVQRQMCILFPIISLLGALTTVKKRISFEDVFLNVSAPMIILMFLKALQYHKVISIIIVGVAVVVFGYVGNRLHFRHITINDTGRRARMVYYGCRRRIIFFLLFALTPMVIWVNYQEGAHGDENLVVFASRQADQGSEQDNVELDIVDEEQWELLTAEEKFAEVTKLVAYECDKLNVGNIDSFAVKEIVDGRLAYYDTEKEAVYFNVAYLNNSCSLPEAAHIVAHECHHRYTRKVIECLEYLEAADKNYEKLEYFHDAMVLREAAINYYTDSLDYYTYSENELEIQAEEYADAEVEYLKKKLGWEETSIHAGDCGTRSF